MPSDFLVDLIDHKRRVGLYMLKAANALFQRVIDLEEYELYADRADTSQMSLIDLAHMYCSSREFVRFDDQISCILGNTDDWTEKKHPSAYKEFLQIIVCDLFERAVIHDNSKFLPEEYEIYDQMFPELNKYGFGTEQFKAAVKQLGPALRHHLKVNSHHPEFYADGIDGMNLLDVIEMTCDWLAASSRSKTGIEKGLEVNKERFKISDQLYCIIKNTVIELRKDN